MDKQQPLLSVGMPVYNGEEDLREALDSILSQTFTDFELLISDNASKDSSQLICEEYAARDSRICYVRNAENIGASDNYNAVFNMACGRYFKWASCNDFCAPTFFEKCVDVLELSPEVILAFPRTRLFSGALDNCMDYQESLNLQQQDPLDRIVGVLDNLHLNNIMNGVIRRDALAKTPLMIPFYGSDCCLMAEVAMHGQFVEVPEYLFFRRMDEESSTSMQGDEGLLEHYRPSNKTPMRFQHWKANLFYFAAVGRAGLPLSQAVPIYRELLRRMIWNRQQLFHDFLFWKPRRAQATTNWKDL